MKFGEKIRYQVPILNLASRLDLDAEGSRARCPWCQAVGRTLELDPTDNRFRCEACEQHGVQVDLVCRVRDLGRKAAQAWLGREYGIEEDLATESLLASWRSEVKRPTLDDVFGSGSERKLGAGTSRHDADIYGDLLEACPMAEPAVTFLAKRGYPEELVEELGLGWVAAPGTVFNRLEQRHGEDRLRQAGLLDQRSAFLYNNHRLLVPFRVEGRVRYIKARRLDGGRPEWIGLKRKQAPIFPHDRLKRLEPGTQVYLVPDVQDALALLLKGLAGFALLGFEARGAEALKPFLDYEVVLCGEPDASGRAFNRAVEGRMDELGRSVRVGEVPPGFEDWNDFRLLKRV